MIYIAHRVAQRLLFTLDSQKCLTYTYVGAESKEKISIFVTLNLLFSPFHGHVYNPTGRSTSYHIPQA